MNRLDKPVMGRPTKYRDDYLWKGYDYIDGAYETDHDDVIPTIVGLAKYIGISSWTINHWAKKHENFSHMIQLLMSEQQRILLNGGMKGRFNAAITKLVLSKHGYHDKVESSLELHTSANGENAKKEKTVFKGVDKETAIDKPKVHPNHLPFRIEQADDIEDVEPEPIEPEPIEPEPIADSSSTFKQSIDKQDKPDKPLSYLERRRAKQARAK